MEVDTRNHHDEHFLVMDNRTLKCVCELCTCGKHQCPRPRIKGNFSTSYADQYKSYELPKLNYQPNNYKYEQRHYNADALRTNYQDTYVKQPANNYVSEPSRLENIGNKIVYHVPFIGSSSYKEQYKPYRIQPLQENPEDHNLADSKLSRSPSPPYRPPPVKFQGITSYKSQFLEPPKVESRPIPQQTYQKVQVPFYGASSYKNDFPQYKLAPQQRYEEPNYYKAPSVKFQGHTSYNDSFKGFSLKAPEQELSASRKLCAVERLNVPPVNYINDKKHIYYDEDLQKFV